MTGACRARRRGRGAARSKRAPLGVGEVFARAGDGELDQRRRDGREDGEHDGHERVAAASFAVFAAAAHAEDGGELHEVGDGHDGRGHDPGDRLDQDVAVGDVRDFMSKHALELFRGTAGAGCLP